MVTCKNFDEAKLEMARQALDDEVKEVKISFNEKRNCWYVTTKEFSDEE